MAKLTDKQKIFCREYLRDFNATQAAIRAGYSKHTARKIASENLSKLDIRRYIRKLTDDVNERTDNDIIRIINELQIIAFGQLRDVADWNAGGLRIKNADELGDESRIISEISETVTEKSTNLKIKMHDKLKALEMLGRYHKIFSDKESEREQELNIKLSYDRGAN